jgi:D-tyrosyl-tRNA(Tyr) deacylase
LRAVVQRVSSASVTVDGAVTGRIGFGMLVLLGVAHADTEKHAERLADKLASLRFFNDDDGKMNLSCLDVGGEVLVVSQFTLYGDCRKGRRPSYTDAAQPEKAQRLYQYFIEKMRSLGLNVASGVFGAMMEVSLVNQGPVTLIVDV